MPGIKPGMTKFDWLEPMTVAPDSKLATLWCPSPNVEKRRGGRAPDMLLLHYTGMETAEAALDWLTREESKVSCHYLIDEEGRIAQMVPEDDARLACRSEPVGRRDRHQFLLDRHRDP